jgi:hypothetical protein
MDLDLPPKESASSYRKLSMQASGIGTSSNSSTPKVNYFDNILGLTQI